MRDIFINGGAAWGIASIIMILLAWRAIRQKKETTHRKLLIILVTGSWIFVLVYFIYKLSPESQVNLPENMLIWLAVHGFIAVLTLALASIQLFVRLKNYNAENHFIKHHVTYGRWILPLWIFTHLGGLMNAWLLS